jgi:hypothetical protein
MPKRSEDDGPISLCKTGPDAFELVVGQGGKSSSVKMSRFNAWRAFGLLAIQLGIRLPREISEKIEL